MRRVLLAIAVSFASSSAFGASQGTSAVVTTDGTRIEGDIVKRKAGEYVVIKTASGEVILVGAADVARVEEATPPKAAEGAEKEPQAPGDEPSKPAEPRRRIFEIGGRTGYSHSFGSVASGSSITDYFPSQIPLQLDVGFVAWRRVYFGLYGRYALGTKGDRLAAMCDRFDNATCSTYGVAAGLQVHVRLDPIDEIEPWFGVGSGVSLEQWKAELRVPSSSAAPGGASITSRTAARGLDFVRLMGGADYRVSPSVAIGAFLELSISKYLDTVTVVEGDNTNVPKYGESFPDKALHYWLTIGPRLVFSP